MEINHDQKLRHFWKQLSIAETRILFLDYDGTLAPFKVKRDSAEPYPGVREILTDIISSGTRIVMVTGRTAEDMLSLLKITPPPEVWGVHGMERLHPDGRLEKLPVSTVTARGLKHAIHTAREAVTGNRIEEKHGCVALHWRGLNENEIKNIKQAVASSWERIAKEYRLILRWFDGGLELQAPGRDKGIVVKSVLNEVEVQVVCAYLGDDLTDEDGFKAIKGRGLSVLVRGDKRDTEADITLRPPDELLWFLHEWSTISRKGVNTNGKRE